MDNPVIELSWSKDGTETGNVVYDGNGNSTKSKSIDGQNNQGSVRY